MLLCGSQSNPLQNTYWPLERMNIKPPYLSFFPSLRHKMKEEKEEMIIKSWCQSFSMNSEHSSVAWQAWEIEPANCKGFQIPLVTFEGPEGFNRKDQNLARSPPGEPGRKTSQYSHHQSFLYWTCQYEYQITILFTYKKGYYKTICIRKRKFTNL